MSKVSSITNRWGEVKPVTIKTKHFLVFRGYAGSAFNHHHQITSLDDCLYATWSNGDQHEDDVGQRMVMSISKDHGETWSKSRPIVARQRGKLADAVIASGGIYVCNRSFIAYYGKYEYTAAGLKDGHRNLLTSRGKIPSDVSRHEGSHAEAIVSEDEGKTWSKPTIIVDRFLPNLSPQATISGRLIMPGSLRFPYTDDPSGLTGWSVAGIPRLPTNYVDDPEGFHKGCRYRGDACEYCEGSFFQTEDEVLHMMLRTNTDYLAVTESHDNGQTWSEPMMTSYTDCQCRFHFGRLPDGRYFGLSCPESKSVRTPMVLATSEDGVVFNYHYILGAEPNRPPRFPGYAKGGRYGYPYSHIMGEYMFVIYSIAKEDIAVCRFHLSELK